MLSPASSILLWAPRQPRATHTEPSAAGSQPVPRSSRSSFLPRPLAPPINRIQPSPSPLEEAGCEAVPCQTLSEQLSTRFHPREEILPGEGGSGSGQESPPTWGSQRSPPKAPHGTSWGHAARCESHAGRTGGAAPHPAPVGPAAERGGDAGAARGRAPRGARFLCKSQLPALCTTRGVPSPHGGLAAVQHGSG